VRLGVTLIEVTAGLGLLATVLVLVFSARDHVARQQVRADRRLAAVAAADALLADWLRAPATFPRAGAGVVPGRPELTWSTRPVPNPAVEALGGRAVRLEVGRADDADRNRGGAVGGRPVDGGTIVVAVEVVLPADPPPPTAATAPPPPTPPRRR
jgi:hypothetical protein